MPLKGIRVDSKTEPAEDSSRVSRTESATESLDEFRLGSCEGMWGNLVLGPFFGDPSADYRAGAQVREGLRKLPTWTLIWWVEMTGLD